MSDQALFPEEEEKSSKTLEHSAASNLAWKLLQQEEICKSWGGDTAPPDPAMANTVRRKNGNGHWDDPVKKSSSFQSASPLTYDDDADGPGKSGGNGSFRKGGGSAALFRSTISHKSAEFNDSVTSADGGGSSDGSRSASPKHVCSPQDYEIHKTELFQYDMSKLMNHIKLMTCVSNDAVADDDADNDANPVAKQRGNFADDDVGRYPWEVESTGEDDGGDAPWSDTMIMMITATTSSTPPPWLNMEGDGPVADKDNLLRHIFALLDRNHDSVLEYIELYKAEMENLLQLKSIENTTGCLFRDFILFNDTDYDDITMISLDKALETKRTRVVEFDNVLLRCDINGSPPPEVQWKRYGTGLSQVANLGIKTNIDGTLSLTNVHMIHAAHYSCQSPMNPEIVQTHVVDVESEIQSVYDLFNMVPHNSRASSLYPAESAFPLKTAKSVIAMDAETLRPRCKFYEEIPELQSFLTVYL